MKKELKGKISKEQPGILNLQHLVVINCGKTQLFGLARDVTLKETPDKYNIELFYTYEVCSSKLISKLSEIIAKEMKLAGYSFNKTGDDRIDNHLADALMRFFNDKNSKQSIEKNQNSKKFSFKEKEIEDLSELLSGAIKTMYVLFIQNRMTNSE